MSQVHVLSLSLLLLELCFAVVYLTLVQVFPGVVQLLHYHEIPMCKTCDVSQIAVSKSRPCSTMVTFVRCAQAACAFKDLFNCIGAQLDELEVLDPCAYFNTCSLLCKLHLKSTMAGLICILSTVSLPLPICALGFSL